jgi:hypothetical protein
MKKYLVIEQIGHCQATVEKAFDDYEDAKTFKTLLEKSRNDCDWKYYISVLV